MPTDKDKEQEQEKYTDCLMLEYSISTNSVMYIYYDHYETSFILRGVIDNNIVSLMCKSKKNVHKFLKTMYDQDDGESLEVLRLKNYKYLPLTSDEIDYFDLQNEVYESSDLFYLCGSHLTNRVEMLDWIDMTKDFYNTY